MMRLGFLAVVCLAGCVRVQATNSSTEPVEITVSAAATDSTEFLDLGTLALDGNSSVGTTFQPPPYSVFSPGHEFALLRFASPTAGEEELLLPQGSVCVVNVTPQGYLDLPLVPVPDDAQLRRELLARLEGLDWAVNHGDSLTAAQILLRWVCNNVDLALVQSDQDATTPIVVEQSASYCYHELFRRDRGAVYCGGYAVFFQKVLLLFGIDALVIDFGDERSGLTHMSVVLPKRTSDGTWEFYLYDPTFNVRCTDSMLGLPLNFFTLLDRQRFGMFDTVQLVQGSSAERDWAGTALHLASPQYQLHAIKGNRYLYRR
ncbi:MAG TPA: hypothetical protein VFG20_01065, partial [Planctomycetaceae bacterium]|nr:hypothetical protein [Planctomycetaceae bacterium]